MTNTNTNQYHLIEKLNVPELHHNEHGHLDTKRYERELDDAFKDWRRRLGPEFGAASRQDGKCLGYTDNTGRFHAR